MKKKDPAPRALARKPAARKAVAAQAPVAPVAPGAARALDSNRLVARFGELASGGRKAFVAYIMAGEPSRRASIDIVLELERSGVTAVELGVPFSDPIADGPVIQAAGNRALAAGVTLRSILDDVAELRERTRIPILLMGYWNVFLKAGREKVLDSVSAAGVDGLIIPDLPLEADRAFYSLARERGLATVLLATELTRDQRLREIAAASTGFVYYVPKLGITGTTTGAMSNAVGIQRYRSNWPMIYLCTHVLEVQLALADMILGGTLHRFPNLKVGAAEAHVHWVESWLRLMDQQFGAGTRIWADKSGEAALTLKPSEYFRRQVLLAGFPDDVMLADAYRAAPESIVVCSDWPHPIASEHSAKGLPGVFRNPEVTPEMGKAMLVDTPARFL